MSDAIDELIKDIAIKHGIAVSRDDPIMILQTINQRLMQDTEKAQQVILEQFKSELEDLAVRWGDDAKDKAEKILNASLEASKKSMETIMLAGATETVSILKADINTALELIIAPYHNANKISTLNIVASCITIIAAAIVLWATITGKQ